MARTKNPKRKSTGGQTSVTLSSSPPPLSLHSLFHLHAHPVTKTAHSRHRPVRRRRNRSSINKTSLRSPQKAPPSLSLSVTSNFRAPQNAFPQFSRLPKELQLRIWEMTTEEPRIVIIRSSCCPSGRGIWSPTPVPAALHVCAESRAVALKTYKLSFSVSSQNRLLWPLWHSNREERSFPAQVYFNFARDVLYFRSGGPYKGLRHFNEFMAACLPADRQRVQAVGLDIVAKAQSYTSLYGAEIRRSFERLETFFVCKEKARFKTKKAIRFCALQKGQEWAFVRHYMWHLERAWAFKHLSLAEALDKVKDEILSRHAFETESGRPDIRFVTVSNL